MASKRKLVRGEVTLKRYGRKHFRKISKLRKTFGGPERQYPACPRYDGRHRFNPATGICWGCGFNRNRSRAAKARRKANP